MKENKKIITILVAIVLIILIAIITIVQIKESKTKYNSQWEIDKNQISYQDNATIEELKNEVGITETADIYEIQEEFDGRKVAEIKPSIRYKVAFAGMINKDIPKIEEIDKIWEENTPDKNGIWIEEKSREKILNMINTDVTNSTYSINDEGYLELKEKNNPNDIDKLIQKIIKGKKQFILDLSSVCYIIDTISAEILDYNFENLDKYQTYEYFEDNDKMIIFITENSNNLLTEKEIITSVVELMKES